MAKLRLGCLPLRIETGRFSVPKLDKADRVCLVCQPPPDDQEQRRPVEDEPHFLFSCNMYTDERKMWYLKMGVPSDFEQYLMSDKLKFALNRPENIKLTAHFIQNAYEKRGRALQSQ